jgi:hypothetical protein
MIKFCNGFDCKRASNFVQISKKVQQRSWKWLNKHSGKKAWAIHGYLNGMSKLTETEQRQDRWRAKSRACSWFSLTSRELYTKSSFRQAKRLIQHTTVMCYGHCIKMYKDFGQTLATKELALASQHTVSHFHFYQRIFDQKQYDCHPPPNLLFSFTDWS